MPRPSHPSWIIVIIIIIIWAWVIDEELHQKCAFLGSQVARSTKMCSRWPNFVVPRYGPCLLSPLWRLEFCSGPWIFGMFVYPCIKCFYCFQFTLYNGHPFLNLTSSRPPGRVDVGSATRRTNVRKERWKMPAKGSETYLLTKSSGIRGGRSCYSYFFFVSCFRPIALSSSASVCKFSFRMAVGCICVDTCEVNSHLQRFEVTSLCSRIASKEILL
jgi:hypothetical protein